ncbi:MAG: ABC transporter permease subunit, partial [Nitratireductor sp.]
VSGLPHVRQAISIGPVYLSNRSINFPVLVWSAELWIAMAALIIGICLGLLWTRWTRRHFARTGQAIPAYPAFVLIALAVVAILTWGVPVEVSVPELRGFDFEGGARLSMQFVVIAATLAIYHGAQITEVVRGGLQAIPNGQTEAAKALGLKRWQIHRLVVLPQVIRIIVPPMNNQYVNLIKNTSISIAVGYSDLMSVSGTIINQSFRPLEMMLLTMGIYLALCVALTTVLNRFHQRLTAREAR